MNQSTLSELSKKQVINLCDGKNLGHTQDLVIDLCDGKICAIIVPESCGFGLRKGKETVVPWYKIQKIGEDTILVDAGDLLTEPRTEKRGRKGTWQL